MSFFTEQTSVVDLGDGNTVTLRKLTYGESADILSASMKVGEIDWVKYRVRQLEKSVIGWSGPGFEGREITPSNIAALPVAVGRKISDAANDLNTDVSADEGNA